jgi:hypothetical protein
VPRADIELRWTTTTSCANFTCACCTIYTTSFSQAREDRVAATFYPYLPECYYIDSFVHRQIRKVGAHIHCFTRALGYSYPPTPSHMLRWEMLQQARQNHQGYYFRLQSSYPYWYGITKIEAIGYEVDMSHHYVPQLLKN